MDNLGQKDIIFFDGVCELCDRFVNFVFLRDKKQVFYYAPLQGETAKQVLENPTDLKYIMYFKQGVVLKGVEAVRAVFKILYPRLSVLLRILPGFIYRFLYSFIAKRRYQIFGKKEALYIPTEEQKLFFLS